MSCKEYLSNLLGFLTPKRKIGKIFRRAIEYHNSGDLNSAKALYHKILGLDANHGDACHLLGVIEFQGGNNTEAIRLISLSIQLTPDNADAFYNLGLVFQQQSDIRSAITFYKKSLKLDPTNYVLLNRIGTLQHDLRAYEAAIESYDAAIAVRGNYAEACFNRGLSYQFLRQYQNALDSYAKAISIKQDYAKAFNNRGIVFHQSCQFQEAVMSYQKAISLAPDKAEFYVNFGILLVELNDHPGALNNFEIALYLCPEHAYLYGRIGHLKMYLCKWGDFASAIEKISIGIADYRKMISPFAVLSLVDNPFLQQKVAEIYVADQFVKNCSQFVNFSGKKKEKIRVGYFSADFRNHAVALLMADFFALHDKSRFESIGFSFKSVSNDNMQLKIRHSFDSFFELENQSDEYIVNLSRDLQLDIAVDLGGFTQYSRFGIFVDRVAPVQLSYLGFLGTSGSNAIDYLVADKIIIPDESLKFYTEKIIYLPCYQVNPSSRKASERIPGRSEYGLPQQGFVFGCFSNTYKLNPIIFSIWMRIISQVLDSVLFIYVDNDIAEDNLKLEAELRGINPRRLIFGKRLPVPEYLSRFAVIDLLLDTYPYNGGATVSDALWMGVPVLTCTGKSFASRVAASILQAAGYPELITRTLEEYEIAAVEFSKNSEKFQEVKERLKKGHSQSMLYNTSSFARSLEAAYLEIHQRQLTGLLPDHINIKLKDN